MKADRVGTEPIREASPEPARPEPPGPPASAARSEETARTSPQVKTARPDETVLVDPTGAPVKAAPPKSKPVEEEQPEEARPIAKRRWVWVVAGIIGLVLLLYLVIHGQSQAKAKKAAAAAKAKANAATPVTAVAARTGDFPVYLVGLGTVTGLNTVTVRSRVDGQLVRVDFAEGQSVRAGDLLAQIDPRPFQVQLTQAEGQKAKDEAALRNARLDLQRYQTLAQQDAVPRQQLDTQAATVAQFEATVQTDQGLVDSARLNLTYCRITAPLSGRVGLRLVDPGNMVHANDTNGLAVITQVQPIAALFTLPEDSLPAVLQKARAGVRLKAAAFGRDQKTRLATGELLTVDNQIDPTTGTVRLKAVFPNQDSRLYPNQFVNLRLQLDTLRGVVLVPAAAIQRSPQATYVYVVQEGQPPTDQAGKADEASKEKQTETNQAAKQDQTDGPQQFATMRAVEVLRTEGDTTALQKGVAPGEMVVIDGVDRLHEGSKVAVRQPGQRPPEGIPGAEKNGKGKAGKQKKAA